MVNNSTIHIHLHESRNANIFSEDGTFYEEDIKLACDFVKIMLADINALNYKTEKPGHELNHDHRTISIFGRRGSGKTSFLLTLLSRLRTNQKTLPGKIHTICPIDPNLIEGPEIFLATVVAKIIQKVQEEHPSGCIPNKVSDTLMEMAAAFRIIAPTGSESDWGKWMGNISDRELFASEVLIDARSGLKLATSVRLFIEACCEALKVDAIVIPFDDVDTDLRYGWIVLETIRRYLATPRLITIISGDMTLYRMLVRSSQWPTLEHLVTYEKEIEGRANEFIAQINQLEEQYLKKLLPSGLRVHLEPLNERIWRHAKENWDIISLCWSANDLGNRELKLGEIFQRFCEEVYFYPNNNQNPTSALNPVLSPAARILPSNSRNLLRFMESLSPWRAPAGKQYDNSEYNNNNDTTVKNLINVASVFTHVLSEHSISIDDMRRLAYGGQLSMLGLLILRLKARDIHIWKLDPTFLDDEKGERRNQLVLLLQMFLHRAWKIAGVPLEFCIRVLATNSAATKLRLNRDEINEFIRHLNLDQDEYATETANRLIAFKIQKLSNEVKTSHDGTRIKCPTHMAGTVRLTRRHSIGAFANVFSLGVANIAKKKPWGYDEWALAVINHLYHTEEPYIGSEQVSNSENHSSGPYLGKHTEIKQFIRQIISDVTKAPTRPKQIYTVERENATAIIKRIYNQYAISISKDQVIAALALDTPEDTLTRLVMEHHNILETSKTHAQQQPNPRARQLTHRAVNLYKNHLTPTLDHNRHSFWSHANDNAQFILRWFLQKQTINVFGTTGYFASFISGLASLADVLLVCHHADPNENANAIRKVVFELQHRSSERESSYEVYSNLRQELPDSAQNDPNDDAAHSSRIGYDSTLLKGIEGDTIVNMPETLVSAIAEWVKIIQEAKSEKKLPVTVFSNIWARFENILHGISNDLAHSPQGLGNILERWTIAWFDAIFWEEYRYYFNISPTNVADITQYINKQKHGHTSNSHSYFTKLSKALNFSTQLPYTRAMICCPILLACLPRKTLNIIRAWLDIDNECTNTIAFLSKENFKWCFSGPDENPDTINMDCHTILNCLTPYLDPDDYQHTRYEEYNSKLKAFVLSITESESTR
jgi:hypothetical protein